MLMALVLPLAERYGMDSGAQKHHGWHMGNGVTWMDHTRSCTFVLKWNSKFSLID